MEEEKDEKEVKLIDKVEEKLSEIVDAEGIRKENIDYIYKLVDIHKDLKNEKYWKSKEENEMYERYNDNRYTRDFSGYGRQGMKGTGPYSRYNGGRGSGRYRGEDMLNTAYDAYRDYADDVEYGNYGTHESMQKIEIMADSLMDFVEHLMKTAKTPEEKQLIQQKIQEMSQM